MYKEYYVYKLRYYYTFMCLRWFSTITVYVFFNCHSKEICIQEEREHYIREETQFSTVTYNTLIY